MARPSSISCLAGIDAAAAVPHRDRAAKAAARARGAARAARRDANLAATPPDDRLEPLGGADAVALARRARACARSVVSSIAWMPVRRIFFSFDVPSSAMSTLIVSPSSTAPTVPVQIWQVGSFVPGMHGPRSARAGAGASAAAARASSSQPSPARRRRSPRGVVFAGSDHVPSAFFPVGGAPNALRDICGPCGAKRVQLPAAQSCGGRAGGARPTCLSLSGGQSVTPRRCSLASRARAFRTCCGTRGDRRRWRLLPSSPR